MCGCDGFTLEENGWELKVEGPAGVVTSQCEWEKRVVLHITTRRYLVKHMGVINQIHLVDP